MPKFVKITSFIFTLLYLLSILFFPSTVKAYERVLFEDDFEVPNLNMWIVPRNTCSDYWEYSDGRYGMAIHQSNCLSESSPSNEYWDDSWNDYTIDLDVDIISGDTQNIAWRYWPTNTSTWIDIQVAYGRIFFQGATESTRHDIFKINPGKYHFTIIASGEIQKVYFYNTLNPTQIGYLEGVAGGDRLIGRPALQVSNGAHSTEVSEVWFDNIRVTQEVDALDVPYFSQVDPEWKDSLYDSIDKTIGDTGCALTSTAMLLRYYGVDTIPGTSDTVTPLTLNNWLVDNDGYGAEGGLYFPALSALSSEVISANPELFDYKSIEYKRRDLSDGLIDFIDSALTASDSPLIFQKPISADPPGYHFTVGTGVLASGVEYLINDPLNETNNIYNISNEGIVSTRYLYPSNSDLSYLIIQSGEAVNMTIIDPQGQTNESIDRSHFGLELPIVNYVDPSIYSGNPIWEFEQKYPMTGKYEVILTANENGFYEIWIFSMDREGEINLQRKWVYLMTDRPTILSVLNDSINSNDTLLEVDYPDKFGCGEMFGIVDHLYENGYIKHKGVHKMLSLYSKKCIWATKRPSKHIQIINRFMKKRIEKLHPKYIEDFAKEFLLETMVE